VNASERQFIHLHFKEHAVKKFISIFVSFLLSACAAGNSITNNAEKVTAAAAKIADMTLPAGYAPDFTGSMMGYAVASFRPSNGDDASHLFLVQSEKEADGEKLAQALADLAPGSGDVKGRMTVLENRAVTVRGQQTTLVISEGANSKGAAYRQAVVAFRGKGGPAMLVFSEPVTRWHAATLDALIASVR
jgi:hypothetical protein